VKSNQNDQMMLKNFPFEKDLGIYFYQICEN